MRTTVTLDPDTEALVRRRMRERGESFKVALNSLIRQSCTPARHFHTETASLGKSSVNLDRAVTLAGDIEDDELLRRMRSGG
ncbi:MAG: antitoxin [Actinobacteria bacterium]|nr:antitoxin [Actinomycetota bacterium]MCB9411739.1 antitoxin [Actinomycetota bacterium]